MTYNVASKPVIEQKLFSSFPVLFVCEENVNCSYELLTGVSLKEFQEVALRFST